MGCSRFSPLFTSVVLVVCSIAALLMLSTSAGAKGNTVRIVVNGPDLLEPIEITAPDAVRGNADVYRATFIDVAQGAIDDVPSSPVPPYEVKFYVAYAPGDVRMKYVVYYVWDRVQRRARVYFPGRSDAWWRHNAFTIMHPYEGNWYYANDRWGHAVHEAILEHTDPRHLEVARQYRETSFVLSSRRAPAGDVAE